MTRMALFLGWVVLTTIAHAQNSGGAGGPHRQPARSEGDIAELRANRATTTVHLDGRLDGEAWAAADSLTKLRQREPQEGRAATERTVVKVLQDGQALFVGIRAYDSDVSAIRATQLRRDADLEADDNVTILIDSFHDRRSGFLFRTNPNGAMWDAQFAGVDDANPNWNGIWDVAVSRDSLGWTAEFRIPFRTLRFRRGGGGAFGFNVQRFIRRKNETALWRGWGRTEGLLRLIYAGTLTGFEDLRRPRDLEYSLNTGTSFLGFVQFNDEDQRVDFNLRFHWIPKIGDDVFVVWNSGYTTDPTAPRRFPSPRTLGKPLNGALIVKAVHRFAP